MNFDFPKCIRVYPSLIPTELVEVCPMPESLYTKKNLTEDEVRLLEMLTIHNTLMKWENE